jgi:hypothetical protein
VDNRLIVFDCVPGPRRARNFSERLKSGIFDYFDSVDA